MAEFKTNVMRILEKEKISYAAHTYDQATQNRRRFGGAEGGKSPETIYKTLVTRGASREIYVFVIAVHHEINLKKSRKGVGEKSLELIKIDEINKLTAISAADVPRRNEKAVPHVISQLRCSSRPLP
jgi:Cys-tRNA(Pro)/Cys-tRNA(Cys) deacylase